jgi:hypothetical protein
MSRRVNLEATNEKVIALLKRSSLQRVELHADAIDHRGPTLTRIARGTNPILESNQRRSRWYILTFPTEQIAARWSELQRLMTEINGVRVELKKANHPDWPAISRVRTRISEKKGSISLTPTSQEFDSILDELNLETPLLSRDPLEDL